MFVGFDHEEIGSGSATGAAGPLLENVLTRLAGGFDARGAAFATSRCLSVDVTHAAHPNYLGHHEPGHRSVPNGGPTLKVNANQRYATDAPGRRGLAKGLPGGGRADPGVRREEHRSRAVPRSGRSWPPGSASGQWTSGFRCCPCTRRGSCAGSTTRGTWPRRRPRSSPTRADPPVPDHYAGTAAGWARSASRVYGPLARELVAAAPHPLAGRIALDVGAGTGLVSEALAAAGARPIAVDRSPDMLRWRRAQRPPALVADAARLPLRTGAVHDAFAAFLLNHLPEPVPALRELARVTRAGGCVLATVYANSGESARPETGWTRSPSSTVSAGPSGTCG